MQNLLISLIIGLAAAIIDTLPMFIKKLDKMFILSAFFYWLLLGFIIPRVSIYSISWLNGIIVALIILIPMIFLIVKLDKEAIPIIIITSIVLGAGVGFTSGIFIK